MDVQKQQQIEPQTANTAEIKQTLAEQHTVNFQLNVKPNLC